jgi:hypothetical protein
MQLLWKKSVSSKKCLNVKAVLLMVFRIAIKGGHREVISFSFPS